MGPIQKLLDQLGLLRYFSEVYGNIGDTYGQMSNGLSGGTEGNYDISDVRKLMYIYNLYIFFMCILNLSFSGGLQVRSIAPLKAMCIKCFRSFSSFNEISCE